MKIAAVYDDAVNFWPFRQGDTVQHHDNDDNCVVIGIGATGFGWIPLTIVTPRRSRTGPATTILSLGRRSSLKPFGKGMPERATTGTRGAAKTKRLAARP